MKHTLPIPDLTVADLARFAAHIDDLTDPDGCWPWTGATTGAGYGVIRVGATRRNGNGRLLRVHRVAYSIWVGPIPELAVVDHTCLDHGAPTNLKRCCSPFHLEAVGQDVNVARQYLRGERTTYLRPDEAAFFDELDRQELEEIVTGGST